MIINPLRRDNAAAAGTRQYHAEYSIRAARFSVEKLLRLNEINKVMQVNISGFKE